MARSSNRSGDGSRTTRAVTVTVIAGLAAGPTAAAAHAAAQPPADLATNFSLAVQSLASSSPPSQWTQLVSDKTAPTDQDIRDAIVAAAVHELKAHIREAGSSNGGAVRKYNPQRLSEAWCADFWTWLVKQGYNANGIKSPIHGGHTYGKGRDDDSLSRALHEDGSVMSVQDWGTTTKRYHAKSDHAYTPRPGDAVLFEHGTGHVEMVLKVQGNTLITIGGNVNDAVRSVEYSNYRSYAHLVGFVDIGLKSGSASGSSGKDTSGGQGTTSQSSGGGQATAGDQPILDALGATSDQSAPSDTASGGQSSGSGSLGSTPNTGDPLLDLAPPPVTTSSATVKPKDSSGSTDQSTGTTDNTQGGPASDQSLLSLIPGDKSGGKTTPTTPPTTPHPKAPSGVSAAAKAKGAVDSSYRLTDTDTVPAYWRTRIQHAVDLANSHGYNTDVRAVAAAFRIEQRGHKYENKPRLDKQGWPLPGYPWESSEFAAGPGQFTPNTWADHRKEVTALLGHTPDIQKPEDVFVAMAVMFKNTLGLPIADTGYDSSRTPQQNFLTTVLDRGTLLGRITEYNGSGANYGELLSNRLRNENADYAKMAFWLVSSDLGLMWMPDHNSLVQIDPTNAGTVISGLPQVATVAYSIPTQPTAGTRVVDAAPAYARTTSTATAATAVARPVYKNVSTDLLRQVPSREIQKPAKAKGGPIRLIKKPDHRAWAYDPKKGRYAWRDLDTVYQDVAEKAGIPWQLLAAVDYRESGANPLRECNGPCRALGEWEPKDKSLLAAATRLRSLGIRAEGNTRDQLVNALARYKFGDGYRYLSFDPADFNWIMNGLDKNHLDMIWPTDSVIPGVLQGQTDPDRFGVFVVYLLLGGRVLQAPTASV